MERLPVSSSAIASVGYDPSRQTLEVEFTSGALYAYDGVPQVLYDGLLSADSHGRYFASNIRGGGFGYRRL